jgi:hypothetical protein
LRSQGYEYCSCTLLLVADVALAGHALPCVSAVLLYLRCLSVGCGVLFCVCLAAFWLLSGLWPRSPSLLGPNARQGCSYELPPPSSNNSLQGAHGRLARPTRLTGPDITHAEITACHKVRRFAQSSRASLKVFQSFLNRCPASVC